MWSALGEIPSSNEAVSGSPGSTSKCSWPFDGVVPPHSAGISMNALAADVAPSPTTHAEIGIARNVRRVLANVGWKSVAVNCFRPRTCTLTLQNKKVVYDLLFRTSAETLLEVARDPKHLGAEIGFFSVLHTWSQKLAHISHNLASEE